MPPLSLYIHIPWCILKCPYCDFNSHKSPDVLPETAYVSALIHDLKQDLDLISSREISSIFIGGGTPSLFSAEAYKALFYQLQQLLTFSPDIEITLEANPGTFEQARFTAYRQTGINRLSIGIQSFNAKHLKTLGRIHDDHQAHTAIATARQAGFDNINLDIMHGLPGQSIEEGLEDLRQALSYQPDHLSWYQLTIEPNTVFYKQKPVLPLEDDAIALEEKGLKLLSDSGFERYEISAFARLGHVSKHNLNYWLFGDYLGIGAGAHGKITTPQGIVRTQKHRQPKDYLNPEKGYRTALHPVEQKDLVFEFMLNTTRLEQAIPQSLFQKCTGLEFEILREKMQEAIDKGLISLNSNDWQITEQGRRYTNDLQALFLPD